MTVFLSKMYCLNSTSISTSDLLHLIEDAEDEGTIPADYYRFSLIDEIMGQFNEQYPLTSIRNKPRYQHKVVVFYKFREVTYEGTIQMVSHINGNEEWNKMVIRLSHDGFRYPKVDISDITGYKPFHHKKPSWAILSGKFLESSNLVNLKQIAHDFEITKIKYMYNQAHKAIDISMYDSENKEVLMFCFHRGHPTHTDDKEEYYWHMK